MSFKIAYDAGHGLNTPGKQTPDGEKEWSFSNKVVLAFEKEMQNYENVELLRTDDPTGKIDVPLKTRTDKANKCGADIYISFHQNALNGKWGSWTGVETFYSKGSTKGKKLAELVNPAVVKAYGLRDRGLKTNNLHITRETKMPAVLIEGGFMDSTIDIKKLRDDAVLANAGKHVAQAVTKYAGLRRKEVEKRLNSSQNTVNRSDEAMVYYKRGSKGAGVKQLQIDLNTLGYKMPIDGSFGPTTEVFVKQFQKDNNLVIDGSAGPKTLAKIAERIKTKQNKATTNKKLYKVQVGAFEEKDNAEQLREELERKGYKPFVKFE